MKALLSLTIVFTIPDIIISIKILIASVVVILLIVIVVIKGYL